MYKINYFGQEKLTAKYTLSDRLDYEHSSDHCLPLSPLKKKKLQNIFHTGINICKKLQANGCKRKYKIVCGTEEMPR